MGYRNRFFTFISLFIFSLIASSLFTAKIFAQTNNPNFLKTSGKDLIYQDQKIILKGVNFENVRALKAYQGSANVGGTGNMSDIAIRESDYTKLQTMGANTVRFGMGFSWYRETKTQFFQVIDQQVAWARKHRIWLILNMFTTPSDCYEGYNYGCQFWASTSEKEALKNFWVEVATRYKDEPAIIGFDLLNEPTPWLNDKSYNSTWYTWAQSTRDAVYAVDPNHLIFFESPYTKLNATNVVYENHFYTPMGLTHNKTVTNEQLYPGTFTGWFDGVQATVYLDKAAFAGQGDDRANLIKLIDKDWTDQNNVPLLVGEWGSMGTSKGYEQYISDIGSLLAEKGINHTFFTWRSNCGAAKFAIFDYTKPDDLTPCHPERLQAASASWTGGIQPNFDNVSPSPTVKPSPSSTTAPTCNQSDINQDGIVDLTDYSLLARDFFKTSPTVARTDINRDGIVDISDYSLLAKSFFVSTGKCN